MNMHKGKGIRVWCLWGWGLELIYSFKTSFKVKGITYNTAFWQLLFLF